MKKLIHRITGVEMLVADDQLDSFLAAGHRLAAIAEKPAEAKPVVAEKKDVKEEVKKETSFSDLDKKIDSFFG
jgi:hypothetical protein